VRWKKFEVPELPFVQEVLRAEGLDDGVLPV